MEDIVINYLDKNYSFNLSTLYSYKLKDKHNGSDVYLTELWSDMEKIFNLSKEDFEKIWDKWADIKIIELNNRITDIRYKLYELNGTDYNLTSEDINQILNYK